MNPDAVLEAALRPMLDHPETIDGPLLNKLAQTHPKLLTLIEGRSDPTKMRKFAEDTIEARFERLDRLLEPSTPAVGAAVAVGARLVARQPEDLLTVHSADADRSLGRCTEPSFEMSGAAFVPLRELIGRIEQRKQRRLAPKAPFENFNDPRGQAKILEISAVDVGKPRREERREFARGLVNVGGEITSARGFVRRAAAER